MGERDEVGDVDVDPAVVLGLARAARRRRSSASSSSSSGRAPRRSAAATIAGISSSSMRRRSALQVVEAAPQAQVGGAAVAGRAGEGGDRARLQREELVAAQRPLDVLRRGEVVLGAPRQVERRCGSSASASGAVARAAASAERDEAHAVGSRRHHLAALRGAVLDDAPVAPVERPAVGLDGAVDEALVQAVDGLHQGQVLDLRMAAEGDARALAGDDLLDDDGHGAARRVEAELAPVEQCAVRPQRRPDELDVLEDRVDAADVHVRLVQAGERCAGRVLAGRRRAHDGGHAREARGERLRQRRAQLARQGRRQEEVADAQGRVPQLLPAHVGEVLAVELGEDPPRVAASPRERRRTRR